MREMTRQNSIVPTNSLVAAATFESGPKAVSTDFPVPPYGFSESFGPYFPPSVTWKMPAPAKGHRDNSSGHWAATRTLVSKQKVLTEEGAKHWAYPVNPNVVVVVPHHREYTHLRGFD